MPPSKCVPNALKFCFPYVMKSSKLLARHPIAKGRAADILEIPGFDYVLRCIFGEFSTSPQPLRIEEKTARCPGTYCTVQIIDVLISNTRSYIPSSVYCRILSSLGSAKRINLFDECNNVCCTVHTQQIRKLIDLSRH